MAYLQSRHTRKQVQGVVTEGETQLDVKEKERREAGVVTWYDATCRYPAQLMMPWWHVVFGEELRARKRHEDGRLPFFLQARSLPMEEMLPYHR